MFTEFCISMGHIRTCMSWYSARLGSGKADLEKMISRWSDDIHCPGLIMNGSSFSSDAGVHSAIVSQPQAIMCVDEFGRTLANLASDIIGKTALVALTKAYTLSDMSMKPKKYSKDKETLPKMIPTGNKSLSARR